MKTNAIGRFEFVGLPAGDYGLEAEGHGIPGTERQRSPFRARISQRNYTLKLGTLQETVTVVDEWPRRSRRPPSPSRKAIAGPEDECVASGAGGQIMPPKKMRDVAPTYPAELRGTGTDGQS